MSDQRTGERGDREPIEAKESSQGALHERRVREPFLAKIHLIPQYQDDGAEKAYIRGHI